MSAAVNEAIALGLDVEVADAALSKPFGIPATGVFGLADLVGIDVVALVWKSLHAALPETDALRRYSAEPELIARMIAENRLGRKSGAGFVRISARPQDPRGDGPRHRRLSSAEAGRERQPRRGRERSAGADRARRAGRPLRRGGDGEHARLRRGGRARDRRRPRRGRYRHAHRLRLVGGPVRADRPARRRLARGPPRRPGRAGSALSGSGRPPPAASTRSSRARASACCPTARGARSPRRRAC